ncbi:DNA/RNA non-specific endonuclease [Actinomyces marmotae]|uniref:DNA/RNA non-specific endonuclease n=2 Tax=Actinomyces TaxID=1654 RepID=UPI001359A58D|nr:DNA/RNA non-specific endonuclease [Actinomyces marmotae]
MLPSLGGSQVPSAGHDGRDQQRAPYDLGGEGFNGGHLAAHEFGGPPEAINVVPMHRDVNLPVKNTDTFYAFEQKVRDDPGNYRDIRVEVRYADPDITSPTGSLEGLDPASRVPKEFGVRWRDFANMPKRKSYPNEPLKGG